MTNAKVTGLRGIELGVTDLTQSAAFYSHVWGLDPVVSENDTIHLRANGPTLNHVAYEMENIDGLMRGAGRLKSRGFNIEWGVGRHGPGNNVFSYFVEPNGFVVEYTTEVEQIDEAEYIPHDAEYWAEFPMRPCRWGMATNPSNRVRAAMGGDTSVASEEDGRRCEEIMAQTLGR